MRILHLLPHATGGMLRHVQTLLDRLPLDRYEQWCVAPPGPALDAVRATNRERCLPAPLCDPPTLRSLVRCGLSLRRTVRRVDPLFVHGHGYRGLLLAAMATYGIGCPFVFTAHTLPDEVPEKFRWVFRWLCQRAVGVVCVSEAIARALSQTIGVRAGARLVVRVVYNGIEPGAPPSNRTLPPMDGDTAQRHPIVLTAARLAPQKGIDVLLEAWARLVADFPNGLLLIAGDGPQRMALESRAFALQVAESVRFLGFRQDVRALLRTADAAVIPSRTEGQSIFALEAMAEGAPVVATRVGGLPESIRDGETGLLVAPDDSEALASTLRRILSDVSFARKLATNARRFVAEERTIERMLAEMEAFYQEVGARCRRP